MREIKKSIVTKKVYLMGNYPPLVINEAGWRIATKKFNSTFFIKIYFYVH